MSNPTQETQASAAATLVAVDGRTYPLEKADLVARAEGGMANTMLVQSFANSYDEALELTYTLPLPADGAVLGYTMRIGEKLIRAEVQPREQATRAYKDALFEGRTVGLLEQSRPDTFQQKLGNVPPRTRVEITLDVLHPLAFVFAGSGDVPHWEYRFPTVVGVRYHGAPGRVPDQADLSPDRGDIPARVSLALTITNGARCAAHSPSHAIDCSYTDAGSLATLRAGERLDRDVVLRWEAASGAVGVRVVEGSGLAGDDGRYALVTLVPPAATCHVLHRDLTVLLDTSGSMGGEPLSLAKCVVGELLDSLEEGDRFEMIEFSTRARRLSRGLLKVAPATLRMAHEWLAQLTAGGCTEMSDAVEEALRSERGDSQRQVVLVTDGEISFETDVVARVASARNVRLHVVGVGHCPNRALTQQAAAAGRGLELLVGDAGMAGSAAARLVAGTARPVLTNVSVQGTAAVGEKREWLRDVFAGQPLLVTAELGSKGGTLEVRGDLAGSAEPWVERIAVPAAGASGTLPASSLPLGALHGRSVVGELEIRRAGNHGRELSEIDSRIEALGLRHRIASSRTSLIAIEETPAVDPRQPSRRVRLAVEVPAGVSAEAVGLEYRMEATTVRRPSASATMEMLTLRTHPGHPGRKDAGAMEDARLMGATPARPVLKIAASEARWLGPSVLVVEFVTPHDEFMLPRHVMDLEVRTRDGHRLSVKGTIVEAGSSPQGPHPRGMVVRLAISVGMNPTWKSASEVGVDWHAGPEAFVADVPRGPWRIEFQAPQRPEPPMM